ncbi:type II toxin-antitoxin system Phd/YefM family antitoxin [Fructobacillus sp. M2-14]|uniref:Antitoxin n=1 Tax=Fructobacillus broussonetiae TaxID=2713173 RepID=A0ABS5R012_9LACO|nr:type II toxin-antitoxin system Phd/YefM family antitoxin [Fructobacillus broussonetiae]MBS9338240.1 type II toxin-antitoxin system Phd/YefM family antitoxin [Fructobacillus broussonetiae]
MQAVSYVKAQNQLSRFIEQVNEKSKPILITSKRSKEKAVLVSKAEYDNMVENIYVRSDENLERIRESLESFRHHDERWHS